MRKETKLKALLDLRHKVADNINSIVYDRIYSLDNDQIVLLVDLYCAIIDNDMDAIDDITNDKLSEYMTDNDIAGPDSWAERADNDLKNYGINASCLRWIKDIDYSVDYLQINGSGNGFYCLRDEDLINQFLEDCLENLLDEKEEK